MFEKVNPAHPDKVADRIAGALVDYAYTKADNPKIAVEVLIGHSNCYVISETSVSIPKKFVEETVNRISGLDVHTIYVEVPQDEHLAENQEHGYRCGDNGIFKGAVVTEEQQKLTDFANRLYVNYGRTDGKYISADKTLVICQSNACSTSLFVDANYEIDGYDLVKINPLGEWTGGINVDSGATNRKLGSDMGDSVTGGGLHGKDLSKADVSVNIYAWLKAQEKKETIELSCAIGDDKVGNVPYDAIVEIARGYIKSIGGFEKFAEWGLIRPADQQSDLFS